MFESLGPGSLSPDSLKDYIDSRAGDSEKVNIEDSFQDVFHSKVSSTSQSTSNTSTSSSDDIDPFVEKVPSSMFDRPDLLDSFPGGPSKTESLSLTSKRWMKLEATGDVKALKQALSGKTDEPFSGDFSIRLKYREHFHMLAKQTKQYSLSDFASVSESDSMDDSNSALSGWLEMFQDQHDAKGKLKEMTSTIEELLKIGQNNEGGESKAVDSTKLRWMMEGALQEGLWNAQSTLKNQFGSEDNMPLWVDDQFEETGNELSEFLDDTLSDLNNKDSNDFTEGDNSTSKQSKKT